MKLQYFIINLLFGIISIILLISCNSQKRDWVKTKQQNSNEAYNAFISKYTENKHPNSIYIDSAWFHVNKLLFATVTKKDNLEAYYNYLIQTKNYPVDSFIKVINSRIDSLKFDSVNSMGTEDAYSGFYKKYPNSPYYKKSKQLSRDTILTGKLIILMPITLLDGNNTGPILMLETKTNKYDVYRDSDCEYFNIKSDGTQTVFNTKKIHEVGGRMYSSIDFKANRYYSNNKTIKASYIKCLNK